MKRPLIIGYGNPLREDDGIGLRAAELVESNLAPGEADVLQCHQLTPELAVQVQDASLVIFIDAALDRAPGKVSVIPVYKVGPSAWSHDLSPSQLLSLVDKAPSAYWITCGVSRTGWREGLTAQGEGLAVAMAAAALSLLPEHKQHGDVAAIHTMHPALHP
jgi:hydrogenase maturation protease